MQRLKPMQIVELIVKIGLCLVIISGVLTALSTASSFADFINTFFYFTIQSNLILLGVTLASLLRFGQGKKKGEIISVLTNTSLLWILITGLVYHFLLADKALQEGSFGYVSITLHYLSPLLAIANWLFFEEKRESSLLEVLFMLAYPIFYVGISQVRLAIDGFAPYWFLNPTTAPPAGTGSVWQMLAIVAILVLIFSLVGLAIILLERFLAKHKFMRAKRS